MSESNKRTTECKPNPACADQGAANLALADTILEELSLIGEIAVVVVPA